MEGGGGECLHGLGERASGRPCLTKPGITNEYALWLCVFLSSLNLHSGSILQAKYLSSTSSFIPFLFLFYCSLNRAAPGEKRTVKLLRGFMGPQLLIAC